MHDDIVTRPSNRLKLLAKHLLREKKTFSLEQQLGKKTFPLGWQGPTSSPLVFYSSHKERSAGGVLCWWTDAGCTAVTVLGWLYYGGCTRVTVLRWLYYGGCTTVAVLWWLYYGGCTTVTVLGWLCYGPCTTVAVLHSFKRGIKQNKIYKCYNRLFIYLLQWINKT